MALAIKIAITAVDRATLPMRRIAATIGRGVKAGLGGVTKATVAAGRAIYGVGASALKLGGILGGLGLGAAASIYALVDSFTSAGDSIAKASKQAGISSDTLQELRYASQLAGVSAEAFDKGIGKWGNTFSLAQKGTGKLYTGLRYLDKELLRQVRSAKSADEGLEILLSAMSQIKDPAKRSALATAAFGQGMARIGIMAGDGADGIAKARQEAHDLGAVLSKETLVSSESMADSMLRFKTSIGGLRNSIGAALLPILQPMVERLSRWIGANREIIGQKVAGWIGAVGDALGSIEWGKIGGWIGDVADVFGALGAAASAVWSDVLEPIGSALGAAARWVSEAWQSMLRVVTQVVDDVTRGIMEALDLLGLLDQRSSNKLASQRATERSQESAARDVLRSGGSLIQAANAARVGGEITIRMPDAPRGTTATVKAPAGQAVKVKADVGYRSLAGAGEF